MFYSAAKWYTMITAVLLRWLWSGLPVAGSCEALPMPTLGLIPMGMIPMTPMTLGTMETLLVDTARMEAIPARGGVQAHQMALDLEADRMARAVEEGE